MRKIFANIIIWCNVVFLGAAPVTQFPYFCGFETSDDLSAWSINPGSQSENKWTIGTAEKFDGEQSLYISNDAGNAMRYSNTPNIVLAVCSVNFGAEGTYEIDFDYKVGGVFNKTDKGYMRVLLAKNSPTMKPENQLNSTEPTWWANNQLRVSDGENCLFGISNDWWHVNVPTKIIKKDASSTYNLIFAWVNNDATSTNIPSVAIDNVQIGRIDECGQANKIQSTMIGGTAFVSWPKSGERYDLRMREIDTETWTHYENITDTMLVLPRANIGIYDIMLRSTCGGNTSIWHTHLSQFIYETQCFDFLNIGDEQCETGTWSSTGLRPDSTRQKIDFGAAAIESRHTTHRDQTEYDPRTGYKLKTVPEGALASVRLGNWNIGSQYEKVSYEYTVDAQNASILLLQYAIVLENPDHSANDQPRFLLEIFDEKGQMVDPTCGRADFHAPASGDSEELRKSWHTANWDGHLVNWKDWTTVGLELSQYDGQRLRIELTTFDCDQSGHFGYAYFTLSCTSGRIEGMNCGNEPTSEFIGPLGFLYEWTLKDSTEILSRERTFPVDPMDPRYYHCKVTYPTLEQCYFMLEASAIPRFPIAEVGFEWAPTDCQNRVILKNKSHILTVNQQTSEAIHHYDRPCENFVWTLPDGTQNATSNDIEWICANAGDTIRVRIESTLNKGECVDACDTFFVVPAIAPADTTLFATICDSETFEFGGQQRNTSGIHIDSLKTWTGCDSIVRLELTVLPTYDIEVYDTIAFGRTYQFGDFTLDATCERTVSFKTLSGCDSIVTLHLTELEALEVTQIDNTYACANDADITLFFEANYDTPMSYRLQIDNEDFADISGNFVGNRAEVLIPLPQNVQANIYRADFIAANAGGDTVVLPISIEIRYQSGILTQRWNDVIGIYNSQNNGGNTFDSYQWYKNDEPLMGEIKPYLYIESGLDTTAFYAVKLNRSNENQPVLSCGFKPTCYPENISLTPQIVSQGEPLKISVDKTATLKIYSMLGVAIDSRTLPLGEHNVATEFDSGVYLFVLQTDEQTRTYTVNIK